jgi:putative copper resistance protein D
VSFVLALNILFTIAWDVSYALIVGTLLARHWLASGDAGLETLDHQDAVVPARFQRELLLIPIAGLLISHLVHPWFLAASMSGSDHFTEDLALVPTILSSTHQGALWYINSFALAALGMAIVLPLRVKPISLWTVSLSLALMALTKAAAGHAGADGDFTVAEFAQILHVLSTAVWAGAVMASGLFVVPQMVRVDSASILWRYGNRLSKTVTWALVTILATGVYTSGRELSGSLNLLWTSEWGKILLAKIVFVSIAIFLGAVGRFSYLRRPADETRMLRFARILLTESVVMVLVLCLSGWLGNTSPPMAGS